MVEGGRWETVGWDIGDGTPLSNPSIIYVDLINWSLETFNQ